MKVGLSWERVGAAALALGAVGLLAAWSPLRPWRSRSLEARVEQTVARRDEWVTPHEVLALLHDRRVSIELFNLRSEAAYNRFHIADASRVGPADLDPVRVLPATTVKVLVGEDEPGALEVYRRLALGGTTAVYLLEGGVPGWLAAFAASSCRDSPACRAGLALGGRHPASLPRAESAGEFVPEVKVAAGKQLGRGCGS